jgi:hypothetical protein
MPQMDVGAAHFRARCSQQCAGRRKVGPDELAQLNRAVRRGHHRGKDAIAHGLTLSLKRMLLQTVAAGWLIASLSAPSPQPTSYRPQKARRHFISVSYDWQYTQPMSFRSHPVEDLLGRPVDEVHLQTFDYRTHDGQTLVDVLEFGNRGLGIGLTVYPLGSSEGATLAIRGSIEQLPTVRVTFDGPAPAPVYEVTGGRAFDIGAGIDMSDRAPGWGLGSHAFILGGVGRTQTDQRDGTRYFAEGGGGVTVGPVGVDISVKFAVNRFDLPVPHRFYTLPISVRGTLTF